MPNQPKTPIRGVRVDDDLWNAAIQTADDRSEYVSDVIRTALYLYVKSKVHKRPYVIAARLNEREYRAVQALADSQGCSIADVVRSAVLRRPVVKL